MFCNFGKVFHIKISVLGVGMNNSPLGKLDLEPRHPLVKCSLILGIYCHKKIENKTHSFKSHYGPFLYEINYGKMLVL